MRTCGHCGIPGATGGVVCSVCYARRPSLVLVPKRSRAVSAEIRPFVIAGLVFFLLLVGSRLAVGYYAAGHQGKSVKALAAEELTLNR